MEGKGEDGTGMDWKGAERAQWIGWERIGLERSGAERIGLDYNGVHGLAGFGKVG